VPKIAGEGKASGGKRGGERGTVGRGGKKWLDKNEKGGGRKILPGILEGRQFEKAMGGLH